MKQKFTEKFKEAIDFVEKSDISSPNKPIIPHVKRVGLFLFEKGFNDEVIIASLLHDMLEWSTVSEKELVEKFGERVLELVKANSKNNELFAKDINLSRLDTVRRCLAVGDEAMAVKVADVIDGIKYHSLAGNEKEVARFLIYAKFLKENLSGNLKKIFLEDLNKIIST